MAIYFKCPHCGDCSVDEIGETAIDYDNGLFKCTECGNLLSVEEDSISYDEYLKIWKQQESKNMTREEAIKIVKEFINGTCLHLVDQEALKTLIPELAESEDERIRKRLIEYFEGFRMGNVEVRWEGLIVQEVLAWLEKQKEQKPAEWSEEDKTIIDCAVEVVEKAGLPSLAASLKSLRPQSQGVYKQIVHSIYKMLKGKDFYGMPTSNCISLLNDIRVKCKDADECAEILDEPSWKPSDEQMSMLLAVINDPNNAGSESCHLALISIYEQLKKL